MKHLAYKVQRSNNIRDDKQWYYNSAKKIHLKLPYISPSTISAASQTLSNKGLLEIGNYNRRRHDKTQWFHVPDAFIDAPAEDLLRFDADVAKKVGILPAILHYNLYYFLHRRLRRNPDATHEMSPKLLSTLLDHSESAIKKALARLVTEGLIVKVGKRGVYSLPPADIAILRQIQR